MSAEPVEVPPAPAPPAAPARRGWAIALVAGLLLLLCLLPFAGSGVFVNEEFTYLSHARRIFAGELPYRDFFDFVPPLPIWLLVAVLAVTGVRLLAAHVLATLVIGVAALQLVALARKLDIGPIAAWLPGFVLVLCLFAHWPIWSHHWLVVPFGLGALAFAMRGLERPGARAWLGAGVCAGLAGFSVQTDGAALAVALGAGVLLDAWQRRLGAREAGLRLAGLAGGMAIVVGLVAATLAAQGALAAGFADMVRWPMTQYRQPGGINDLPFGVDLPQALEPITKLPAWYVRVYLVLFTLGLMPGAAIAAVAWGAGWVRARLAGTGWELAQARLALVGLWSLAALAVVARAGRSDLVHVTHYAVPGLLFATAGASRLLRGPATPGASFTRWLPMAALLAYLGAGALGQINTMWKYPDRWTRPWAPDERLVRSPVIQYLQTHMRPGDRMAAMPYGGFFYTYGPLPATRWTLLLPPHMGYGSPAEFAAYWAEVARVRPRFVVIAPWGWSDFEASVAEYATHLPAGYHRVGAFASPQYNMLFPAVIYEADASKP